MNHFAQSASLALLIAVGFSCASSNEGGDSRDGVTGKQDPSLVIPKTAFAGRDQAGTPTPSGVFVVANARVEPASKREQAEWGVMLTPFRISGGSMIQLPQAKDLTSASVSFLGVASPSIEIDVGLLPYHDVSKVSGDLNSPHFWWSPLIQEIQQVVTTEHPGIEAISLRFYSPHAPDGPTSYLQLSAKDNWQVKAGKLTVAEQTQPQLAEIPASAYQPPAGQEGLIPTHTKFPSYFLGRSGVLHLPTREWALYCRNRTVEYRYIRSDDNRTQLLLAAGVVGCPTSPVHFDLIVNTEQFGGRDKAVERIVYEVDHFGSTPLSRVVNGLLGKFNWCFDESGQLSADVVLRIFDEDHLEEPLAEKVYGYFYGLALITDSVGRETETFYARRDHPNVKPPEPEAFLVSPLLIDKAQAEARRVVVMARAEELQQNSVFAKYSGGLYFAALHAGDYEVAALLDLELGQPYRDMLNGEAKSGLAGFISDVAFQGPGGAGPLEGMMMGMVDSVSLLPVILGSYLFNFEERYGECLGPDAVTVRITTTTQDMLSQGGFDIPIGPPNASYVDYKMKPEFYNIFMGVIDLGGSDTGMMDALMRGDADGISIGDVVLGVKQIMGDFKCDSREILTLEANSREYWTITEARRKSYLSGMLEGALKGLESMGK